MAVAPESLNSSTFQVEGRSRCVPQGTSVASILAPIVAKGTPTPGSNSWPSSRPPSARATESRWALGRKDEAVAVFSEVLSAVAAYRFFRVVADEEQRWSRCSRVWRTGLPAAHGGTLGTGDERRLPDREIEHG